MTKLHITDGPGAACASTDPSHPGAASADRGGKKPRKEAQQKKPRDRSDPNYKEGWPLVDCDKCNNHREHWKKMHAEWVESDDGTAIIRRTCWECIGLMLGVEEPAARVYIMENQPDWQHRKNRNDTYKAVLQDVKTTFSGLDKKGVRRECHLAVLTKIMTPLMDLLIAKKKWMDRRVELMEERKDLLEKFHALAGNLSEQYKVLEELESFEKEFERSHGRPLAFSKHSYSVQIGFHRAADYCDEWVSSPAGSFRSFYFCDAKVCYERCHTLIVAKAWDKKIKGEAEWTSSGQKWSCGACGAVYKTAFGMLTEIISKQADVHFWVRSPIADWMDHLDVKAMRLERDYNPPTPQALYEMLPVVMPSAVEGFLRPLAQREMAKPEVSSNGYFRVLRPEQLDKIPSLPWDTIFKVVGLEVPKAPPSKKKKGGRK